MKHTFCGSTLCYGGTWQSIAWEWLAKAGLKNVEIHTAHFMPFALAPELMLDEPWHGMWQISIPDLKCLLKRLDVHPMITIANSDIFYRDGVELFKHRLEFARKMGIRHVIGAPWPHGDMSGADRIIYDHWREICDFAEMLELELCMETHGFTSNNAKECLETIERVCRKNLKVAFATSDTFYRNNGLDLKEEIKLLGEHIGCILLREFSGETGKWNFPPLGDGIVDFPEVFEIMDSFGFNGPYLLMLEGWTGSFNGTVERYHEDVVKSINYLRRIGVWSDR